MSVMCFKFLKEKERLSQTPIYFKQEKSPPDTSHQPHGK